MIRHRNTLGRRGVAALQYPYPQLDYFNGADLPARSATAPLKIQPHQLIENGIIEPDIDQRTGTTRCLISADRLGGPLDGAAAGPGCTDMAVNE